MIPPRPQPEDDDNEPLVRSAKWAGRVAGWLFVLYLIYSIGQQLGFW